MAPRLARIIRLEPLCRSVVFSLISLHFKAHNLSIYPGAEISIYVCSMNAHEHFSSWQVYFPLFIHGRLYIRTISLFNEVFDERINGDVITG